MRSRACGSDRGIEFQRGLTDEGPRHARIAPDNAPVTLAALFITGFSSMAMEVIWTRAFTTVLGTYVYSFAALLFTYLWATWMGSWLYRRHLTAGTMISTAKLLALLAISSFLPIVLNDASRRPSHRGLVALASIFPFCAALGYLTPGLVDRYSQDDPSRAGKAYAVNVIGCVLGPLVAGYLLLPSIGARLGLVVLALPFVFLLSMFWRSTSLGKTWRIATGAVNGRAAGCFDRSRASATRMARRAFMPKSAGTIPLRLCRTVKA